MRSEGGLWASVLIGGLFACGCAAPGDAPRVRVDAGVVSADGGGGVDAQAPAPRTSSLPCEADDALEASCRACHAATPRFGAPMPLVTRDDLLAPSPSDPSVPVFEMSARRIADARRPMPPAGTGHELSAEDRARLSSYFAAAAPPAPPDQGECGGGTPPRPGEGPDALPCTPTHTFVAHAPGEPAAPFQVEVEESDNLHRCFAFPNPFRDGEQATAWAPIIDADRVLHHWIMWGSAEAPPGGQEVFDCDVLPSGDAAFVMGWAPGGGNVVLPDDVGLMLDYEWLFLQVHYFDSGRAATPDRSGVAVCTTPTPRANTAGVLAFGTIDIDIPARARGHAESYTCPSWILGTFMRDFNIIGGAPHMHELGASFRSEVLRADGSVTPISVVDTWDFDNQGSRDLARPIAVGRGDEVRVTCRYDNPGSNRVVFGENTQDEMCFDFMMVYPITRWPRGIPRFCAEADGLSL